MHTNELVYEFRIWGKGKTPHSQTHLIVFPSAWNTSGLEPNFINFIFVHHWIPLLSSTNHKFVTLKWRILRQPQLKKPKTHFRNGGSFSSFFFFYLKEHFHRTVITTTSTTTWARQVYTFIPLSRSSCFSHWLISRLYDGIDDAGREERKRISKILWSRERERDSNGFPEEHTRKMASEREGKKGREDKAWNTETNSIKIESEFWAWRVKARK